MTVHEAAVDLVRAWDTMPAVERHRIRKQTSTLDFAVRMRLLREAVAINRADPGRRAEYPEPLQGLGDEYPLSGPLTEIPLAEVVVRSDGGPWAVHNQPCAVCGERTAILDLNQGVMLPCGRCQALGWDLKRSRPRWWQKRHRPLVGVSE